MNGPRNTGREYTGKHRRPSGPGAMPPAWGGRAKPGHVTLAAQLMVIAKEPVPGRVKTRLTPAYTPAEAAELAEAALADTLAAVGSVAVSRRILALAGTPGRWLPPGFDVIAQRGGGLDERLAWALSDARATNPDPLVFIGMDTPQVTPALLAQAVEPLVGGTADATFGMAEDGGFWLLGLREIDPALVLGVPMSRSDTGALALERLHQAGLRVCMLPELADVDTPGDAERIAAATPGSRFAAHVRTLGPRAARPLATASLTATEQAFSPA
jgi:rSAM/selenodomain-associated transferase 1